MKAARVDENQPEIVRLLQQHFVSVQQLHMVGRGCPDIICGWQGTNYLFEIKNPKKPPNQRKLTPDELEFMHTWKGQVAVIHTAADALKIMGIEIKGGA